MQKYYSLMSRRAAGTVRGGLKVAGTLSVLDEADQAGLVSFDQAVAQLRKTSFRVSQAVISEIIQKRSR